MRLRTVIAALALTAIPAQGQTFFQNDLSDEPDSVVRVAVILPISAAGKANDNYVDFYSGALLAARDLGSKGIGLEINVFDIGEGLSSLTRADLEHCDVIIGPVSCDDITSVLEILPEDKYLISPLEQKAATLADSARVIQVPTPADFQTRELAKWIAEDITSHDSAVLVSDTASVGSHYFTTLCEELEHNGLGEGLSGIRGHNLIYNADNNRSIPLSYESGAVSDGVNNFIIASENEAFAGDVVRNVNILNLKKYKVSLYGLSRIRSFGSIDVESLHACSLKTVGCYAVDYTDPDVKQFVKTYRSVYKGEPNSFAFQGYDIMKYFATLAHKFGDMWTYFINRPVRGYQVSFRFSPCEGGGAVNTAVRRVTWNPDYSVETD